VILFVLQRGHVVVVVLVDGQAQLDHAVDAACELSGFLQVEAAGEQTGVEQQPDEVAHGLVTPVRVRALLEFLNDLVLGVQLHGLLALHLAAHLVVTQGLRLHDLLHVRTPALLSGHEHAG